jgi:hypothetical protein
MTRAPLVLARAARLGGAPEPLFSFLCDFERLPVWMPLMRRCRVDNGNAERPGGVGAVRVIDSGVGAPTREVVVALEPPRLLAYSAEDASLRGMLTAHLGILTCEPHPAGGSWLSWLSYGQPGKAPQRWLASGVFRYVVESSLAQLGQRFPLES